MNRKFLALWSLYDFANSIVMITFLFYFSQWLVIDQGKPGWWYNAALIASSVLFIIVAPVMSRAIDATGNKITGLRIWSAVTFVTFLSVAMIAQFAPALALLATVLYAFAMFAYLMCFLYFTPMLNDIAPQEKMAYVSGIGQSANGIGQVVGLLLSIPFATSISLFGDPSRAATLLPATLLFAILALPLSTMYKETAALRVVTSASIKETISAIYAHKPLLYVLLSYFLFSDALLTFANNFPLFLEVVHKVSDTSKSLLTASILLFGAIGAVVIGKLADRYGRMKTLQYLLGVWFVIFMLFGTVDSFAILVPIFLFAGFLFGPIWSVSRAIVGELAPPHLVASSYSYYVLAERFATFIGPIVWSIVITQFSDSSMGYQMAMIAMGLLIIPAIAYLRRAVVK